MQEIEIKFAEQTFVVKLRDEADQSVMREIFKFREYKSAEEKIVEAKDPIIDVGAHVGFFSIYCRALNSKVKIFAVEPAVQNATLLNEHLKMNKLKGIKLVQCGISGQTGKRWLEMAEDAINYRLLDKYVNIPVRGSEQIETYSFADFCTNNKIKKIALLKMDIEGGEYEVFESMKPSDFSRIKATILEYHIKKKGDESVLEQTMRENGFGLQKFPSRFDNKMGFIFAVNKRI